MKPRVFLLTPLALASMAALAQTLPTGGTIVQGSGRIAASGNGMVVTQDSARLIADWQSFSIGAGASVRFVQPSSSSVALNRVTGSDPSRIFGSLTANGHVYLTNPNGVFFAPGAQVDVGSLVASTLNADAAAFMAGNLRLAGSGSGSVVNEGAITAAPGGHVVLAAPQVRNAGSISTPYGTSALVAGSAVEIDPTGSGLLNIRVPVEAVQARLVNSGAITADGGAVQLHAAATEAALQTVMQVGGIVRARSIEQRDGQIVLSGGRSGGVAVDGTLDASGLRGGTIKVLGERVALEGAARLDASGQQGGGRILVGGAFQGQGPEQNASSTSVGRAVVLDASAIERGAGGEVVVWSDRRTDYAGQALARGGAAGGDGGRIEVSGKEMLAFSGGADLRAPQGAWGMLLLDPLNLSITTTGSVATGNVNAGDPTPTAITPDSVVALLNAGNLTLQANNQLSVDSPLTVTGTAASTLTLNAPFITVNQPMTLANVALVADTRLPFSDNISILAPVQSLSSLTLSSDVVNVASGQTLVGSLSAPVINSIGGLAASGASSVSTGTLNLQARSTLGGSSFANVSLTGSGTSVGTLVLAGAPIESFDVTINNAGNAPMQVRGNAGSSLALRNAGPVTQGATAGDALTVGTLTLGVTTNPTGSVTLNNRNNAINGPITFGNIAGVNVAATPDATGLEVSGNAAGSVTIEAIGGPLVLSNPITVNGGNLDLTGVGFVNNAAVGAGPQLAATGGRFFVRSSDYTVDSLGALTFGTGAANFNYRVLGGYTGADPTTGNGFYTNRQGGFIGTLPNGDVPAISRAYDGTTGFAYTQAGTVASVGLEPADSVVINLASYTVTSTGAFDDKNAGVDKGYTVATSRNTSGVDSANGSTVYGMLYGGLRRNPGPQPNGPGVVSVVTPLAITSTGIDAVDRVYDGSAAVALTGTAATLNGAIAGDAVTLSLAAATGTMANKNVGTNKPVTLAGIALAGADAGNYTLTDTSTATATITPRPITSSGLAGVGRVYDGTTAVGVNASAAALTGVLGTDAVTVTGGTGTLADKNVGTAKPVTISAVTLAGADAGNYSVTDASNATATITPRPLTSTGVVGVDRVYDGTTVVAVSAAGAALANAVAGDAVAVSAAGASGTMADKNVGTAKPVTVSGLTLTGADAANYTLTDASNATVTITPRDLAATGITAVNRVADGTTAITLNTGGAGLSGVVAGDNVTLDASGATGSVETPDPGRGKAVFVNGLALGGTDAANYAILPAPVTATGAGLTVRILTVAEGAFEDVRYTQYLQGVSDAQEPFRRAMAEALAAGFGKENIRKQLSRGLVFETGLAAPAVDRIDPARPPQSCTSAGTGLACR